MYNYLINYAILTLGFIKAKLIVKKLQSIKRNLNQILNFNRIYFFYVLIGFLCLFKEIQHALQH